ncbi:MULTISPECIES: phage holin family protein [unclassified Breznakia]|uniref:phage holin family protein n=1 Tax=unclassified Breznakia TaxID=2623764 RepID=UPI002476D38A|nr:MULTISPECIES: phage holin family protein [unclassified Breznakia]MDH6367124.1 toxin secretion/phage lysis holin [Breznakia sp. PH1-1]MDH6404289.1 toxin secretion/phage lysis holin [Breznakia sp. PF1-11]MDH6412011.1 toxin secretion/phage lysis holin [Breznakia sp. PFB1-11]MDH6414277.1 toxin secretion/phage lysis holin [Breznakia sp. PFB1-14]MDH6416625.1 toxin secretion/phage lysis holin [Breznakia sp. PFB1-4]
MKKMQTIFDSVVACVATFLTYLFGGADVAVVTLCAFMALDYATGVIVGFTNDKLSSAVGFKGLAKKMLIILILIGAVQLDRLQGTGQWIFRTLVCYFYIANEGISLIENAGNLGLPIPGKLKKALEQLKDKAEDVETIEEETEVEEVEGAE